jgi:hypothetical protein
LLVLLSDSGKLSFLTFNIELHRYFFLSFKAAARASEVLIALHLNSALGILIFGHAVTYLKARNAREKYYINISHT